MSSSFSKGAGKVSSLIRCGFIATLVLCAMNPVNSQADVSTHSPRMIFQKETITEHTESFIPLTTLITEALENNPEILAAEEEREAAQQRIAPAEALDDPQVEVGVLYLPIAASPFRSEDMTMKMIGLSQRLPFPGARPQSQRRRPRRVHDRARSSRPRGHLQFRRCPAVERGTG